MTRDQKLIALFVSIALITGGVVGARVVLDDPPPVPVVSRDVPVGPEGRWSVQFVGDTMLGGEFALLLPARGQGYDWPFDALRPTLTAADYVVAAAEAPFTELVPPAYPPAAVFDTSKPPAAGALARAGIDAVTLATDGISKSGPAGLADTMREAEAAGLATFGAGPDLPRAEQPLLLQTELGTVGIVGMGESYTHRARKGIPGTMTMNVTAIQRGADLARAAGADWVVAAVHWGDSYAPVQPRQRYLAEQFAAASYDLVVGSGPHHAQPIEVIGATPVVYSVGNFVYGTLGRYQKMGIPGYGLSVNLEMSRAGNPHLTVRCIVVDNRVVGFQPRPCTPAETQIFLPTLNPQLEVQGDLANLLCDTCFARRQEQ